MSLMHSEAFQKEKALITKFGEGNAHLIWVMSIYLDHPDKLTLGSESLTDQSDDKKIDFIRLDRDNRKIVFAQGYYASGAKNIDSAPGNKASDLNTASAWLISGDLNNIPETLRSIISDCRIALENDEIDEIDLLYVHNLPESKNVNNELNTVSSHLEKTLMNRIKINGKEFGISNIEKLYIKLNSPIIIEDDIECSGKIEFTECGPLWKASILSIQGNWLRELFKKYGEDLFSANYRGFLGANKRRKINSAIKTTAEKKSDNFWVFNNGITILTNNLEVINDVNYKLKGISIINGAQTTGVIGSVDVSIDLDKLKVLARIIECSDIDTISEIVKFNNTQNSITTWDKYSNDEQQKRIQKEFNALSHSYSLKRGFNSESLLGIEVVAQPIIALEGFFVEANSGKNDVFENEKLYHIAFFEKKARHILYAYIISKTIDEIRNSLKEKKSTGKIIKIEENQLLLLRNLRFKYFLISVIGKCSDIFLGQNANAEQIAFNSHYSNSSFMSIEQLITELTPLVTIVLSYTSATIDKEFSEYLDQNDILNHTANKVKNLIHTQETVNPTPGLAKLKTILSFS
ncbi:MAG: hypothetical protein FMNOHCHN_03030 [Ignavibacteriaceae bacterium]|nr:hypothetical protein [Ignavibacteriaceae bacterium]